MRIILKMGDKEPVQLIDQKNPLSPALIKALSESKPKEKEGKK